MTINQHGFKITVTEQNGNLKLLLLQNIIDSKYYRMIDFLTNTLSMHQIKKVIHKDVKIEIVNIMLEKRKDKRKCQSNLS